MLSLCGTDITTIVALPRTPSQPLRCCYDACALKQNRLRSMSDTPRNTSFLFLVAVVIGRMAFILSSDVVSCRSLARRKSGTLMCAGMLASRSK